MKFEVVGKDFVKDGKPIKLLSGAVHYFRNVPEVWDDIFKKAKAMGLNCIETYTAWNLHEPQPGKFNFEGNLDIAGFIRCAAENDLMVIVRPGPYICAEWEFGGLPWWLQNDDEMEIRCMNKSYISHFCSYLSRLFEEIRPLLATNGGPVIMLQCENEYGYYGDDKEYLLYLRDVYRKEGIDVPLFTSDGSFEGVLLDGTIEGCVPTLNFGSDVKNKFEAHDKLFPNAPKMCMEMWCGWFDEWEDDIHHTTSVEDYTKTVSDMLEKGSMNIYMFIGGTNFGFTNGANHNEKFTPHVTSYDYDAILSECGDITPKYLAIREILKNYADGELPEIPPNRKKMAYGKVTLTERAGLFANLKNISNPIHSELPKCMEKYGIGHGYIMYRSVLGRDYVDSTLSFESLGDRALVYVGEKLQGIAYINDSLSVKINAKAGDVLTILVENMGRTNFGPKMMRKKGIAGRLLLNDKIHFSWDAYPLPMDNLENIDYSKDSGESAKFYRGTFKTDNVADTFLRLDNFSKGFVTINGFNLGRYWEKGPQKTLYVPSSLLKTGENEIVVFDSDGLKGSAEVEFVDTPDLG